MKRDERTSWEQDFAAALPPWLVARVLTVAALGFSASSFMRLRPSRYAGGVRLRQGLLAWDGDWYLRIARDGYASVPPEVRRYFPLYPFLARALSYLPGVSVEFALVLIANFAAFAAGVLLHRLARREFGDEVAGRATWLLALSPASFVLVLGYAEGLSMSLALAAFLAIRRQRWKLASIPAFLGGLVRPTGLLITVPIAWEAAKCWRNAGWRTRLMSLSAVVAPAAGVGLYLAGIGVRFGDPLEPLRVQQSTRFRGGMANPLVVFWRAIRDLSGGYFGGNAGRVPFAFVVILLTVVCIRRLPGAYSAYAVVNAFVMLSTTRWGSLERYALATFPLVVALAMLMESSRVERALLAISAAAMTVYAFWSFLALAVP